MKRGRLRKSPGPQTTEAAQPELKEQTLHLVASDGGSVRASAFSSLASDEPAAPPVRARASCVAARAMRVWPRSQTVELTDSIPVAVRPRRNASEAAPANHPFPHPSSRRRRVTSNRATPTPAARTGRHPSRSEAGRASTLSSRERQPRSQPSAPSACCPPAATSCRQNLWRSPTQPPSLPETWGGAPPPAAPPRAARLAPVPGCHHRERRRSGRAPLSARSV